MHKVQRLKTEARALGIYSNGFWHRKCIEPVKRQHGNPWPEWQVHRFEIKGGISWNDAMLRDMCAPNPLLKMIAIRSA